MAGARHPQAHAKWTRHVNAARRRNYRPNGLVRRNVRSNSQSSTRLGAGGNGVGSMTLGAALGQD
jgi:hypothetical protein